MIQTHAYCWRCKLREAQDTIVLANRLAASRRGWLDLPWSPAEPHLLEALWHLDLQPESQQDVGRRVVDFLFCDEGLAVEVDGASHSLLRDKRRDDELLREHGIRTFRVPAKPMLEGKADEWAEKVYAEVVAARAKRDAEEWLAAEAHPDAA